VTGASLRTEPAAARLEGVGWPALAAELNTCGSAQTPHLTAWTAEQRQRAAHWEGRPLIVNWPR
jgi:hypothetical protein